MTRRASHVDENKPARERAGTEEVVPQRVEREALGAPSMHAGSVLALQRSAGNHAVSQLLRAHAGGHTLARAGDPEGMMVDHAKNAPTKMTFHHIIPENKLEKLWDKIDEQGHFKHIKTGLQAVTTRGLAQFDHAAKANIKRDLNAEVKDLVGKWEDEKFEEIVAEAKLGTSNNTDITKKFFPGIEKSEHEFHFNFRGIVSIFNRHFKILGESSTAKISATVNKERDEELLADGDAKTAVKKLIMWMPGNIHRGPTTRFTPKDGANWKEDLDDGGDKFESAAKKVVSPTQFTTVDSLNKAIDKYLATPDDTGLLADVSKYLDEMKAYSMTEYNPDQWEEVERGTSKKNTKKAWTFK